ncbi:hypothetical protein E1A91_A11G038700v1 [Gossypium mustelinum]|uniref:Exonuclease domain-containing protein n=1 Tax=Gossypium mustelinum TaxID=34275 RepID=A0A5D2X521_GOSMU|nr:hypothetical protein E1A91_A11G038700v1 [Gossypium mustelinum]
MNPKTSGDRSEICFFDLETTIPRRRGQGFSILEFGAILVCPKRLVELKSFASLVRPDELSSISLDSVRFNGITRDAVAEAPSFSDIAEEVYGFLHGSVWAGHNIVKFDCVRIREAFEKIGRPAPEPKGIIDSLALLTKKFGRRAGDMKMETLANYFGLGKQTHRSLDDVRMNLEVLKYCATVLFLESSLPDIFTADCAVSPGPTTSTSSKLYSESLILDMYTLSPSSPSKSVPCISLMDLENGEDHPIVSLQTCHTVEVNSDATTPAQSDPFDMTQLKNEIKTEALKLDAIAKEKPEPQSPDISPARATVEGCSGYAGFLELDEVSTTSISVSITSHCRGTHRIKLLHRNVALQLCCPRLRVRFGINPKFVNQAGWPRLSFLVDATPIFCEILDSCDAVAKKFSEDHGSSSEWRHVVIRNYSYVNNPTVRLHIPTIVNGDTAQYGTEIHRKDQSVLHGEFARI